MNKGELVDRISQKATVTKKQADAVFLAATQIVIEDNQVDMVID